MLCFCTLVFLEYWFGCGQFTWPQLQLPFSGEVITCHLILVTQRKLTCTACLFYTWLGYTATTLCKICHKTLGFLLSAQQSGQKWWNFYLCFIAFTAGNRTIASSYWGSSEQYAVKKLYSNSLGGSHTPRTPGTHRMLFDIAVNFNWIKGDPTSAVCLLWITLLFYREQVREIKLHHE